MERRGWTPLSQDAFIKAAFVDGAPVHAGVPVTESSVMGISAFFSGVRLLSDTISTLPRTVHKRNGQKREAATKHPAYKMLRTYCNPILNPQQVWEMIVMSFELRGVAYAEVVRDNRGRPVEFWPLHPNNVRPSITPTSEIFYIVKDDTNSVERVVSRDDMFHLRLLPTAFDASVSPIQAFREGLGLAIAVERYGAAHFGNGAKPAGVFIPKTKVTKDDADLFMSKWNAGHQGVSRAHRMAILPMEMGYQSIGLSPEDSQFLETRKLQVTEVARVLRIPPAMLYDLEYGTFSNTEQQGLEFDKNSIRPRLVRIEEELNRVLFTDIERDSHYVKFNSDALLRGDLAARYSAYAVGRQWGWLSVNDVRRLEDENPIEDGDVYMVPTNMAPADKFNEPEPEPAPIPPQLAAPEAPAPDPDEDRGFDALIHALHNSQHGAPVTEEALNAKNYD